MSENSASASPEGMPSQVTQFLRESFRGLASAIAMPGSLLLRVQMGERIIGPLAMAGLFVIAPGLMLLSQLDAGPFVAAAGFAGGTNDAALSGIIYALAFGRWAWEWVNNREREQKQEYVLSRYHGRVWFLPAIPGWFPLWVAALLPFVLALWAAAFLGAFATAAWLTVIGLGMVGEVLYLMVDWRRRLLDMRDAFIDQEENLRLDRAGLLRGGGVGEVTMQQIAPTLTAAQMIEAARRFDNRGIT